MKTFYKSAFLVLISLASQVNSSKAQDFLPGLSDNYMGINQATLQPAAIVDSRFKTDINFFGIHSEVNNDAMRFRSKFIMDPFSLITNEDWIEDYTYLHTASTRDKNMFMSQSLLGPSFLISIGQKHAIGFTYRLRSITNVDDIGDPLLRTIYSGFGDKNYWNKWYLDEEMRAVQHNFIDYGLSYAAEIMNTGPHFLKGGITVKLLQGISAAYLQADSLIYYFDGSSGTAAYPTSWNSPYMHVGVSDNWGSYDAQGNYDFSVNYQYTSKPSAGLDVGVVYEFRPKYMNYRYDMDGETGLERKDQNKYLLKVGVSLLDVGRLRYKKDYNSFDFSAAFTPDYLQRYINQNNSVPPNTQWMEMDEANVSFQDYVSFIDTIYQRSISNGGITKSGSNSDKFTIKLPTALSLQVDVNIIKGFYINLITYTGLNQGFANVPNSHYVSNYSITPRYEHKWFTVSVPVQYDQYEHLNIGIGLRAGFVYFGVNNLFTGLISDPYGLNAYAGVKIPIFHGRPPSDRDGDKVSDEKDLCPDIPGLLEFSGCPDRDGDGVPDKDDLCPDEPGLKEFNGCPDRDGDGVPDKDDLCPDEPGLKLSQGCPDRDGDGVVDSRDECPDVFGLAELNGCPDRDGDGVPDKDDLCPDEPGPKLSQGCPDRDGDGVVDSRDECPDEFGLAELNGCPDRDGDGVPDHKDLCPDLPGPANQGGCPFLDTDGDGVKDSEDDCPEIPGPPENRGCPYTDTDGDGVIDKDDRCPLTPGDPANFGCPIIKEEEAVVLKTAFENLEFETGKALIKASSFTSLDELATLLISKPAWKLKVSGHTDNVGNDESNMTLSKNRAQSTAKYLQGKGVAPSQLIIEWFGETKPIADNATPEGRQINRRVEMQLVFE